MPDQIEQLKNTFLDKVIVIISGFGAFGSLFPLCCLYITGFLHIEGSIEADYCIFLLFTFFYFSLPFISFFFFFIRIYPENSKWMDCLKDYELKPFLYGLIFFVIFCAFFISFEIPHLFIYVFFILFNILAGIQVFRKLNYKINAFFMMVILILISIITLYDCRNFSSNDGYDYYSKKFKYAQKLQQIRKNQEIIDFQIKRLEKKILYSNLKSNSISKDTLRDSIVIFFIKKVKERIFQFCKKQTESETIQVVPDFQAILVKTGTSSMDSVYYIFLNIGDTTYTLAKKEESDPIISFLIYFRIPVFYYDNKDSANKYKPQEILLSENEIRKILQTYKDMKNLYERESFEQGQDIFKEMDIVLKNSQIKGLYIFFAGFIFFSVFYMDRKKRYTELKQQTEEIKNGKKEDRKKQEEISNLQKQYELIQKQYELISYFIFIIGLLIIPLTKKIESKNVEFSEPYWMITLPNWYMPSNAMIVNQNEYVDLKQNSNDQNFKENNFANIKLGDTLQIDLDSIKKKLKNISDSVKEIVKQVDESKKEVKKEINSINPR